MLDRALGCFFGQLAGDSLGSLVGFMTSDKIAAKYPQGVRNLSTGGPWGYLAGQPSDCSEMSLMLANAIIRGNGFYPQFVKNAYCYWLASEPLNVGKTTAAGILGNWDYSSQTNGAIDRVSPLGIWGAKQTLENVASCSRADARITHPHLICQYLSSLYCMAISEAIRNPLSSTELYRLILKWIDVFLLAEHNSSPTSIQQSLLNDLLMEPSHNRNIERSWSIIKEATILASLKNIDDFSYHSSWALTAWHNAIWQLLHAGSLEEALVATVGYGGDTSSNGAVCGALLGAVYGQKAVPERWRQSILDCRPDSINALVAHPRPEYVWPCDVVEMTEQLLR